jgi:hypothetical protein
MKKLALALIASAFAVNATAAELSFNNLGLTYQQADFDCSSDCDGFGIKGSVEFNEMFFGEVDYFNVDNDVSLTYLGLGLRHNISDTAAIYGLLGAARIEVDSFFFDDSETKAFAGVGIRGMMTENFEGEALVRKVFIGGLDPAVKLSGTYFFTETVGGQLFVEGSDGDFGGGIGLRVNF